MRYLRLGTPFLQHTAPSAAEVGSSSRISRLSQPDKRVLWPDPAHPTLTSNRRYKAKSFHIRGERGQDSLEEKEGSKGKLHCTIHQHSLHGAAFGPLSRSIRTKLDPKRQLKGNHIIWTRHLFCRALMINLWKPRWFITGVGSGRCTGYRNAFRLHVVDDHCLDILLFFEIYVVP